MGEALDLNWDGRQWEAAVAIPYFAGSGEALHDPRRDEALRPWGGFDANADDPEYMRAGPEEPGPFDFDVLFRDGRFRLSFDTEHRKRRLSAAELRAWDPIAARGDAVWAELMDAALAEYLAQRPTRVRWWRAVYGELPYDREMPAVADVASLRRIVRPYNFIVHPTRKGQRAADVTVQVMCTWVRFGFGVRLRGGQILGIVDGQKASYPPAAEVADVPGLGRLSARTRLAGPLWSGQVPCDPMRDFAMVAEQRATVIRQGRHRDRPRSIHFWEFARGQFPIHLYVTAPGELPSAAQVAAVLAFRAQEAAHVATILGVILQEYTAALERNRLNLDVPLPDAGTVDDLRELMEFREFFVHPADDAGRVRLVLCFMHVWGDRETVVLWRDGQIERFGRWADRLPAVGGG